jgi:RNA polymerase sigma-70 factor (ECF subfamily)
MLQGIENEIRVGKCKIRKPSKHADNQYTLISFDDGRYFVSFEDGEGDDQTSEISKDLYLELLQQARSDEAYLRWTRRHLDASADVDAISDNSADTNHRGVEDAVIAAVLVSKDSTARSVLTDLQWHRLELHYLSRLTYEEIAVIDKCTKMAVNYSVRKAIKKLQKIL